MNQSSDWVQSTRQKANAELADRAVRHAEGQAMHRPVQVYLQLASACNLSCYMCSEYNRPPSERHGVGLTSLSPEMFAEIETKVFPWSSQLFLGVGGEPTYSEHFVDYVERAGLANQQVHLITNGTFLRRKPVAVAVANHVSKIQVSIDAANQETYERIRIGARWSSLMKGIEMLQEARAKSALNSHLTLNFVLMRSNVTELPDFVELAHSLGADRVHAQHVIAMTEPGREEPLILEPERFDEMRARAIERARSLGIEIDLPAAFDGSDRAHCSVRVDPSLEGFKVPCRDPFQTVIVLYDGRVFACCHPLAHDKMCLGNLNDQGIDEIWNQALYRRLRTGLRTGDVPEICQKCSVVHTPPPEIEDYQAYFDSPNIQAYYGLEAGSSSAPEVHSAVDSGAIPAALDEYVHDLRQHADSLALERPHLVRRFENLERDQHELSAEVERMREHIHNLENLGPTALLRRLRSATWKRLKGGPKA